MVFQDAESENEISDNAESENEGESGNAIAHALVKTNTLLEKLVKSY